MPGQYIKPEYKFSEFTSKIIACCIEVHKTLGPGFAEVIYQRALVKEFQFTGLEFGREAWIDIFYKGSKVGRKRLDFVVEEVMLEIKTKSMLDEIDFQQAHSYLLASGYPIGLLVNSGGKTIEIKRIAN